MLDELVAFDGGGATFTIQGSDFAVPVSARCDFRQTTATIRFVQFTPRRFGFVCSCEGLSARFVLLETDPDSGVRMLRAERVGEWIGESGNLTVRSVHSVAGSTLPLAAPVGYRIDADGAPVATVELNGMRPQLRLPANGAQRRDALPSALTRALFWDPAAG